MKNNILLVLICGSLSACVHIPISAKTDKGEQLQGQATGSLFGADFQIVSSEGTTCSGPIPRGKETTKILDINCSDGRHGQIVLLLKRDAGMTSGTGTGKMTDGTRFTFTFGNPSNDGGQKTDTKKDNVVEEKL